MLPIDGNVLNDGPQEDCLELPIVLKGQEPYVLPFPRVLDPHGTALGKVPP